MQKDNPDFLYNHLLNQYLNSLIIEINNSMYDGVYSEAIQPLVENGFVFSKGMTKISVDDKSAIPIGEPNQPIRSNV